MSSRLLAFAAVIAAGTLLGIGAVAGIIKFLQRPSSVSAPAANPPPAASAIAYDSEPLGAPVAAFGRPEVTHVQMIDFDQDGLMDVLYCESSTNTVRWIRQIQHQVFHETILAEAVAGPVHVAAEDIYGNGRLDLLVAGMGQVLPNRDAIGTLFVFEHLASGELKRHVLLDRVARVTDVRAANLRGHPDGRLDLVVGQFGYDEGATRWLENLGDWQFRSHLLNGQSGCIHTPVADFDGDGRLDIAALISQEWEEVHLFRNLGDGRFTDEILWGSTNEDFGSSGMQQTDLNRDGRPDLVFTNGDGFDYSGRGPRAWHGVQWLENLGDGDFVYHHVGTMPGAYAPSPADLNGDGHVDLATVSGFGDWSRADTVSLMVWLNDGQQNFRPVTVANSPIQMVTADAGDLDGDGVAEIVTGGYHAFPPFENMSSITLWRRR